MRILLLFTLLASQAVAQTPQLEKFFAVPGATRDAKRVQWLWGALPTVIKACRAMPSCGLTDSEKTIVDKMIANLPMYNESTLHFVAESADPTHFTSEQGEAKRVAITGLTASAPIDLNTERIGTLTDLELIAILGHETVHHTGVVDDENRIPDQIGAKLGHYFQTHMVSSDLTDFGHPEIQVLYFGIGVPESVDYFKIFPAPTVAVNALVRLSDRTNVFALTAFDPDSSHDCAPFPGTVFVNQQVSDPLVRINRWFPADAQLTVNFNVLARSVCLVTASAPDADMKGLALIGSLTAQFDLPSSGTDWTKGELRLHPATLRAMIRPRSSTEGMEAVDLARITKVNSAPQAVSAGKTWTVDVMVNSPQTPTGCAGTIHSDHWHSVDLLGLVPPLIFDRCNLQPQGNGIYRVQLEKDIPGDAIADTAKLGLIALYLNSQGQMISAYPATDIPVRIESAVATHALILSHGFVGLSSAILHAQQSYVYQIQIQDSGDISDVFVSGQGKYAEQTVSDFAESVAYPHPEGFFQPRPVQRNGRILTVTYDFHIPLSWQAGKLLTFSIWTLQATGLNFSEAFLDLRQHPETYQVVQ